MAIYGTVSRQQSFGTGGLSAAVTPAAGFAVVGAVTVFATVREHTRQPVEIG
ncbi:hypothetical protein [Actinoplanes sp. NPDC049802]|uniref:hypothetical protein n=1 Tax=Actinoplanes sp. NPDC049802 TaxID=3154742 RepID=UPI0033F05608